MLLKRPLGENSFGPSIGNVNVYNAALAVFVAMVTTKALKSAPMGVAAGVASFYLFNSHDKI